MRKFGVPIVSRYGSILVQLLLVAIVTRTLDQADAGRYFVIVGAVSATMYFAGFGLPDGLVKYCPVLGAKGAHEAAAALLRNGFVVSVATVPLCTGVFFVATAVYVDSWSIGATAALCWTAYGVIFIAAQAVVATGRGSLGTSIYYSAANTGQLIITIPAIVILKLDELQSVILALALGTLTSASACALVAWRVAGKRTISATAKFGDVRAAWNQGLSLAANRVVMNCIAWVPVWIAGFTLGAADAAVVGLASRLAGVVGALNAAVRFSLRPTLARDAALGDWKKIEKRASKIGGLAFTFALFGLCGVLVVGPSVIPWIFGPEYTTVSVVTALMLVATIGSSVPIDEVLKMSGHARVVLLAQIVAVVGGMGAQTVAADLGGVNALAFAYGGGTALMYVGLILYLWRVRGVLILPGFPRKA
ncbi:lipopolysaccharide biosynthesis protein [Mycolicibacterium poriferae]|uniref:lipopolysaccharide biosynthesis protein n=1 Tax=Mycolicibacterium poriferae TaxID=39694 RepID=UPI0013D0C747|nr:lipopolysaccharide biosynthesis protein [Mycolicibacterium poriferae]MCV7266493.1 lipopolysaccharide biosynthesis protein [Mycolicibacterium poriferae]